MDEPKTTEPNTFGARLPPEFNGEDRLPKALALAGAKTIGLIIEQVPMVERQRRVLANAITVLEELHGK